MIFSAAVLLNLQEQVWDIRKKKKDYTASYTQCSHYLFHSKAKYPAHLVYMTSIFIIVLLTIDSYDE